MHKNFNDIIPPSRRRTMMDTESVPTPVQAPMRPMMTPRAPKVRGSFPTGTFLVALVVIAASVGALFYFSGAKVVVTPQASTASIMDTFTATFGTGDLPFQIVTVGVTKSASVPAESTENSTTPAQGTISITNTQEKAQPLIKNTRFESANGLIFRIRDSVTVPAAKGGVPGTLSVTVYADEAGDKYNIAPTSFTLPGLKGSATFTQVTAKSDAAMSGGFTGTRPSVGAATRDKQFATLESAMAEELKKQLAGKIPVGYVLVPGASVTNFEKLPDGTGTSGTVELNEKGTTIAYVMPDEALARQIALKSIGTYTGQPVTLGSVDKLAAKPVASITADATEFAFTLSGDTSVVWVVDGPKIAAAVAGKTRNSAENMLVGFPEVQSATFVIKPFWKSAFPEDPAKITVEIAEPKQAN